MNVGSVFSGIGGIDLGLERAGMSVAWQSEVDPFASRVLAKHWPNVPNLGDVSLIDWRDVEPVDLICGGYPCQPFSLAGVRGGHADPRHLWPHFATALRELRPRWALLENVPGHLSLGFGRVLGDLAELGFDAEWDCIPAAAVGAPHLRYRVFVVAHSVSNALWDAGRGGPPQPSWSSVPTVFGSHGPARDVADPDSGDLGAGLCESESIRQRQRQPGYGGGAHAAADADRERQPQPSWLVEEVGGRAADSGEADAADADGGRLEEQREPVAGGPPYRGAQLDGWWATEPDVGRVAHGVPQRVDRLRTLGNAVVPQVAEWIGHRIMEAAR